MTRKPIADKLLHELGRIQAHKVAGSDEVSYADLILTNAVVQMYYAVTELQQVAERLVVDASPAPEPSQNPEFKDPHKPDSIQGAVDAINNKYGYCPKCGAPGRTRERRLNGNDRCYLGHVYPSRDALKEQPERNFGKKPGSYYLGKASNDMAALHQVEHMEMVPKAIEQMAADEWEEQINFNGDFTHDRGNFTVEEVINLLADRIERLQSALSDVTRKAEWGNGI